MIVIAVVLDPDALRAIVAVVEGLAEVRRDDPVMFGEHDGDGPAVVAQRRGVVVVIAHERVYRLSALLLS